MPDYDLSDGKFKVTITGKILNEDFARILIKNPDLTLQDIFMLDNVQKHKAIPEEGCKHLKNFDLLKEEKGIFIYRIKLLNLLTMKS